MVLTWGHALRRSAGRGNRRRHSARLTSQAMAFDIVGAQRHHSRSGLSQRAILRSGQGPVVGLAIVAHGWDNITYLSLEAMTQKIRHPQARNPARSKPNSKPNSP